MPGDPGHPPGGAAAAGDGLVASDLELITLVPRLSWTAPAVDATLQTAVAEAGVPRVIVDDHGGDRTGGVRLFQERHPETLEVDAIGHKAACVLERRLESDPRWPEFHWQVGPTRCAIQQTELAFLVPPGPRPKVRFMNRSHCWPGAGKSSGSWRRHQRRCWAG